MPRVGLNLNRKTRGREISYGDFYVTAFFALKNAATIHTWQQRHQPGSILRSSPLYSPAVSTDTDRRVHTFQTQDHQGMASILKTVSESARPPTLSKIHHNNILRRIGELPFFLTKNKTDLFPPRPPHKHNATLLSLLCYACLPKTRGIINRSVPINPWPSLR